MAVLRTAASAEQHILRITKSAGSRRLSSFARRDVCWARRDDHGGAVDGLGGSRLDSRSSVGVSRDAPLVGRDIGPLTRAHYQMVHRLLLNTKRPKPSEVLTVGPQATHNARRTETIIAYRAASEATASNTHIFSRRSQFTSVRSRPVARRERAIPSLA